jgi:hypothetical protein
MNARLPGRKHRQDPIDRSGGEHEDVIGDALAGFRHHGACGAIDGGAARRELERDLVAGGQSLDTAAHWNYLVLEEASSSSDYAV